LKIRKSSILKFPSFYINHYRFAPTAIDEIVASFKELKGEKIENRPKDLPSYNSLRFNVYSVAKSHISV